MEITEGYLPYLGYQTYYRTIGASDSQKAPLILIHGGPGSTHNYFELLDELANDGRQVIMYDQLGCGKSSMPDAPELWTLENWLNELKALKAHLKIEHCHLLGQSWGGMLVIAYLCDDQPQSVLSAIFSSTLSSAKLWAMEQRRLIKFLPIEEQKAIEIAEQAFCFTEPAYLAANQHFMSRHVADEPTECSPEPLSRPKKIGTLAYETAWGPNEYCPSGTLKTFDYTDKLKEVNQPVLITSGINDLCTPLIAKTMFDELPNAKWELFAKSRHMPFVDENKKYLSVLKKWLNQNDHI